ncbi:hypothetical protein [Streptomyces sp. NPDC007346]|uniref:hypothetical protein n=1 Tax=Streptomyces sp. NPDC007346 TaxID=3154682 RepID=UPI00345387CD
MSVNLESDSRQLGVENWLLRAAPDKVTARREWEERLFTVLPCGAWFDAVRIPARLVEAAAQSDDPDRVGAYLAAAVVGAPVIHDRYSGWYYALVPAGTARWWHTDGITCLGVGAVLGVPHPGVTAERRGSRVCWAVPMGSAGDLCAPPAVSQVVALGGYREVSR